MGASAERLQAGAVPARKGLRGFSAAPAALAQADGKLWAAQERSVHATPPIPPFPPHPGPQSSNAAGANDLELDHSRPTCRAEHPQISSSSGLRQLWAQASGSGDGLPGRLQAGGKAQAAARGPGAWGKATEEQDGAGKGTAASHLWGTCPTAVPPRSRGSQGEGAGVLRSTGLLCSRWGGSGPGPLSG